MDFNIKGFVETMSPIEWNDKEFFINLLRREGSLLETTDENAELGPKHTHILLLKEDGSRVLIEKRKFLV